MSALENSFSAMANFISSAQDHLISQLLLLSAVFVFSYLISQLVISLMHSYNFKSRRKKVFQESLKKQKRNLSLAISFFAVHTCLDIIQLSSQLSKFLGKLLFLGGGLALSFACACFFSRIIEEWIHPTTKAQQVLVFVLRKTGKTFVLLFGLLLIAQNLGVQVFSLLAGLGVGGLAVALAAKDTCSNLFGFLMIVMDTPFKVGDWIVIGDVEGTVVDVGIRSTRVKTFYDSVVSIPNSEIASGLVDNMGVRKYRRCKFYLALPYDTVPDKIATFCDNVRNILTKNPHVDNETFHVRINRCEDSSLKILVYFFLNVKDWTEELKIREEVILEILQQSSRDTVRFALPARDLHIRTGSL